MPNPAGENIETYLLLDNPNNAYGVPDSNSPRLYSETHHLTPDWVDAIDIQRGTWAEMQAIASPFIGQRWMASDQFDAVYVYSPGFARWRLECLYPGQYAPIEYGADPFGVNDSRAAIIDALTAASTSMGNQPLAQDGHIYGEIIWTTGAFLSSSSIDLPDNRPLRMSAKGGGSIINNTFSWQTQPIISFTTGGFRLQTSQSNALSWDGIGVVGAPALFVDRGSGPGVVYNSSFRSNATGIPAVQMRNTFWGTFFNCGFAAFETSTPSILIESSSAFTPGLEGWLFRWYSCRFDKAGVRWDINGTHTTVVGESTLFDVCDTENFASGGSLFHVRNIHATDSTSFKDVVVRSCASP